MAQLLYNQGLMYFRNVCISPKGDRKGRPYEYGSNVGATPGLIGSKNMRPRWGR